MWNNSDGLQIIDLILEGTSAELDGNVITADKGEVADIRQWLKNNCLESKYIILER